MANNEMRWQTDTGDLINLAAIVGTGALLWRITRSQIKDLKEDMHRGEQRLRDDMSRGEQRLKQDMSQMEVRLTDRIEQVETTLRHPPDPTQSTS